MKRRALAVLTALACTGLAACGGGGSSGTKGAATTTITLYSGQHPQTTDALVRAFEQKTGIHVRVRSDDESALAQQIVQEGSSSPADVFVAENPPALTLLSEKRLLSPVDPSTLSNIDSKFNSSRGDWVGVSARVAVFVYNTHLLTPAHLPSSLLDLSLPNWKGKVAFSPTETDFQPLVASIAKSRGDSVALSWLKGLKANASAHTDPSNEVVSSDVNNGQAAIGIIDHYYWYRLDKELGSSSMHSQVGYWRPRDPGYVFDVSGAAVLKSSKHQAAAQQLLGYLVSAAGQQVMVGSDSFEYPLRAGVLAPPGLPPFSSLQPAPLSAADLGDGSKALKLIQQAQLA